MPTAPCRAAHLALAVCAKTPAQVAHRPPAVVATTNQVTSLPAIQLPKVVAIPSATNCEACEGCPGKKPSKGLHQHVQNWANSCRVAGDTKEKDEAGSEEQRRGCEEPQVP